MCDADTTKWAINFGILDLYRWTIRFRLALAIVSVRAAHCARTLATATAVSLWPRPLKPRTINRFRYKHRRRNIVTGWSKCVELPLYNHNRGTHTRSQFFGYIGECQYSSWKSVQQWRWCEVLHNKAIYCRCHRIRRAIFFSFCSFASIDRAISTECAKTSTIRLITVFLCHHQGGLHQLDGKKRPSICEG